MGYPKREAATPDKKFRKYVRYKEGAELYGIGSTKFQQLAKEAKAVYKVDGICLVNTAIFERYLESFKLFA